MTHSIVAAFRGRWQLQTISIPKLKYISPYPANISLFIFQTVTRIIRIFFKLNKINRLGRSSYIEYVKIIYKTKIVKVKLSNDMKRNNLTLQPI